MAAFLVALCACSLLSAPTAQAQASFVESFDNVGTTGSCQDGPQNLISRGWIFRNQSSPKGTTSWQSGFTQTGWPSPQAGTDYTARALTTLIFSAGQTTRTVTVPVKGDKTKEPNETLFLNLSGAVNATISDAQAQGTIINDD